MHWHILGPGAIGCLMAYRLTLCGSVVTLLPHRAPNTGDSVSLTITEEGGEAILELPWEPIAATRPISHLLVTTKAHAVVAAIRAAAPRLTPNSAVVVLANGIGYGAELQQQLPQLQFTLGTTTEGAYRTQPWQITHAGDGATTLGRRDSTEPPNWFNDWQRALPACQWTGDIEQTLWRKLAINCAINPLTAIHCCLNGQLATDPALTGEVKALCKEIAAVGRACGQHQAVEELEQAVFNVIAATADNHSSMHQDIANKRPSEIDYITGFLLREANRVGVSAPRNQALLSSIHCLEEQQNL